MLPSFFDTNNIGEAHGDFDGLMNPFFKCSLIISCTFSLVCGFDRYGAELTGLLLPVSILC